MVAGGLFNAFAGAGYLFKIINREGYGDEIKRHNLAMEQLTSAQQAWNQKEIEKRIRKLQQEHTNTNADLNKINKSFKKYKKVMEIVHNGRKFSRKPHIWDVYTPSEEMREYMTIAIRTMGLIGGWTGGKLISQIL